MIRKPKSFNHGWRRKYALLPVHTRDGYWVWLDYYWRFWWEDPMPTWAGDASHWQAWLLPEDYRGER